MEGQRGGKKEKGEKGMEEGRKRWKEGGDKKGKVMHMIFRASLGDELE